MTYVLIVLIGTNGVAMQEFNSKRSCEAAIEFVRDNAHILTDQLRVEAPRSAARFGVQHAAALYDVSPASLYKWRKVPALVAQMMEVDDE